VWDVRVGTNGGPVIEFDDHLVMFEAGGGPAPTLARIDAANALVRGKQVTAVIVSHHHFDHTAGLRAAVSRGLSVISHRGNEGIIREMIERPASVYPDDLAKSPHLLQFVPVDEHLAISIECSITRTWRTACSRTCRSSAFSWRAISATKPGAGTGGRAP
jgi:glyoxylase-like metal-dependent hydrolase (beta-lactamase superfamily II)